MWMSWYWSLNKLTALETLVIVKEQSFNLVYPNIMHKITQPVKIGAQLLVIEFARKKWRRKPCPALALLTYDDAELCINNLWQLVIKGNVLPQNVCERVPEKNVHRRFCPPYYGKLTWAGEGWPKRGRYIRPLRNHGFGFRFGFRLRSLVWSHERVRKARTIVVKTTAGQAWGESKADAVV